MPVKRHVRKDQEQLQGSTKDDHESVLEHPGTARLLYDRIGAWVGLGDPAMVPAFQEHAPGFQVLWFAACGIASWLFHWIWSRLNSAPNGPCSVLWRSKYQDHWEEPET